MTPTGVTPVGVFFFGERGDFHNETAERFGVASLGIKREEQWHKISGVGS